MPVCVEKISEMCSPKALWQFAHFWEFEPPLHGGSKNFFLCKLSKNKAENDFELAETTFSGFSTFNTGNTL